MDALGNSHEDLSVFCVHLLHIGKELVQIKIALGQVDQIRAGAELGSQSGTGSQPAGVAAHDLHDSDHAVVVNSGVLVDLHAGGGDIFCRAGKAGAVVGAVKIVVNGLGNTHNAALIAHRLHIAADLVAGVHRIVAAVIEEVSHIIFFENLKDPLVIGVVHFWISDLIAAGAKLGRGGVEQQLQLCRVFLIHNIELVLQHTLDAVGSAVHLGDLLRVESGADNTVSTGVDDGGGAAGLTENAGSYKFLAHIFLPPIKLLRKICCFY